MSWVGLDSRICSDNLIKLELSGKSKVKLKGIVKRAWNDGLSSKKIQKIYDNALFELKEKEIKIEETEGKQKILVDELVGLDGINFSKNLRDSGLLYNHKKELAFFVRNIWVNGGSCDEIKEYYDSKLSEFRRKEFKIDKSPEIKLESENTINPNYVEILGKQKSRKNETMDKNKEKFSENFIFDIIRDKNDKKSEILSEREFKNQEIQDNKRKVVGKKTIIETEKGT